MSLVLDERRRAMLLEMGLRIELPLVRPAERADVPAESLVARTATPTESAIAAPATDLGSMDWDALAQAVAQCRRCALCGSRRNAVLGAGDPQADWLIVGEAPGESEDLQGEPFVGQAGVLLDNMLKAIGLGRERNVYITNVLKCRPPGNRNPEPQELVQCTPYLQRQVELLQPKVILAMGRFAVQALLQSVEPIGKLRGQVHQFHGVPVIVTFHPAYLLRNLPEKARAWADLCLALEVLQQPVQRSAG